MSILFCIICGSSLSEDAKFCPACGAAAPLVDEHTETPETTDIETDAAAAYEHLPVSWTSEDTVPERSDEPEEEPEFLPVPEAEPQYAAAGTAPPVKQVRSAPPPQRAAAQRRSNAGRSSQRSARHYSAHEHPSLYQTMPIAPLNTLPPAQGSKYELMSTAAYLASILLLLIPALGFLIAIIWAVGGCRKYARRNLARAYIILCLIGFVLLTVAFFVSYFLFADRITAAFEAAFPGYSIDWSFMP